ncbi:MAG: outer membrane beta-barrel domain-containing protein [Myxococcales bacterium]|nr:outer membrane beta-barrel domain-containing protein [Myxococcales bacterium]MCB9520582.1 outer membrane beta-barrel domain-containing protein [Myxococcales bacterium]MCB9531505.1 outer membrane beta-barrel domain-containing protein [Myxococcales bacterium]
MRAVVRVVLAVAVALGALVVDSAESQAQSRSLQSGPAVRRQLLFRSDRFELAPLLGSSIAPAFKRSIFLTVTGRYHLTNAFGLGVNANVGVLDLDTSVTRNYADIRLSEPVQERSEVYYAEHPILFDFHLSYVPLSGKANLIGNHILHWDVFLTAGVGGAMRSSDADDVAGFSFGPAIGVGMRTFVSDKIAVTALFQDYLYSSAEAQRYCCGIAAEPTPVEERFRSHVVGSLGVSVFFPSDVRVSR